MLAGVKARCMQLQILVSKLLDYVHAHTDLTEVSEQRVREHNCPPSTSSTLWNSTTHHTRTAPW